MHSRVGKGFTLIELMIVILIVAVLMAIAIPAYNGQVRKSRRAEAIQVLNELVLREEKWRAENPRYTDSATNLMGVANFNGLLTNYDVTITGTTATSYIITTAAKAGNDQNNDKAGGQSCATLNMSVTGSGAPTRGPPTATNCFSR